ncbi:peptide ABC transporter substrate-binding protein [Jeotgalicoccus coquinae]|uniref:Peptide/nickel transport system substrate-binding protein n=1 Tax=Jeotgalicoccus coquinae TaxID=709509 RepID=A0A6V7RR62_9STAP|nr:ABC transporter substrate-binding protein [Jeotgalicoccus coquinae]MBB6423972.1 peptide/nickel transport system substrate-binding protein [Jeotgalicoccus coquinae]GGE23529.1 peptide ABC transporter substrate-binding protein [Jeotgalicoccus coquinae]CAD2080236.1 Periplasmic dipeptide transport protein precursor [Jeotgalicoccus coquinae]
MKKKRIYFFLMVMTLVLILAACGSTDDAGDSGTEESGAEEGEGTAGEGTAEGNNNVLTIALGTDMVSFDVHNHTNTSTEAVHINMFNYLVKRDPESGEYVSDLAESFEAIDDTTWEFKLKEGVKFHNGEALDSEDVKYSLERPANDDTTLEHINYEVIEKIEVIDDLTFQIHTATPDPALLNRIARMGSAILPSQYIEENGFDHFLSEPVGTGPFQFNEWVKDDRIVLDVYEDYFEGVNEEWEQVVFRVIPENSTRVSELLTGGVDLAVNMPPSEWDRIENNEGTHMAQETSNRTMMLFVRHTEGWPTADKKVREALDLAIDNNAISENLLSGRAVPTITRVAPGNFGFNEELYDTYNYDLERARELLEEAGYGDGLDITLHSPRGRYLQDAEIAEMVAGMWSQIGVNATVEFMEWSSFVDMRNAGENKDVYLLALGNSMFDAANALDWYDYERFEGQIDYQNEEFESLVEAAEQNMDLEEREQQYIEAQEILAEDVAHPVLHQESINIGVSDFVNYTPTIDEMIYVETITKSE